MKLFGLFIFTKRGLEREKAGACMLEWNNAVKCIVETLKQKDKIYLESIVIKGQANIENCVMFTCSDKPAVIIEEE